jgi:lysine 6-dehydrogenase
VKDFRFQISDFRFQIADFRLRVPASRRHSRDLNPQRLIHGDAMKLLVIGSGMMGSAAAYDMARSAMVDAVTLVDIDQRRAKAAAARVNRLAGGKRVAFAEVDAADHRAVGKLMKRHQAALSCVPYFFNYGLAQAAIDAKCHFADLGGNNAVVRQELALDKKAGKRGVRIAPDCGLSPGLASILAGDLLRGMHNQSGTPSGRADALKIYVGGLPQDPRPPFHYQLVFSVEGLINEYAEPAKILRNRKIVTIEPLTEVETFKLRGFPELEAPHLRRNFDSAGNLRRAGRRVLRKDIALSRTRYYDPGSVRLRPVL